MHDISGEDTTTEEVDDIVTEEYLDDPVTIIQSLNPISSTISPISHITECPLCECLCPTVSPIIQYEPTPLAESSLNSTSKYFIFLHDLNFNKPTLNTKRFLKQRKFHTN